MSCHANDEPQIGCIEPQKLLQCRWVVTSCVCGFAVLVKDTKPISWNNFVLTQCVDCVLAKKRLIRLALSKLRDCLALASMRLSSAATYAVFGSDELVVALAPANFFLVQGAESFAWKRPSKNA